MSTESKHLLDADMEQSRANGPEGRNQEYIEAGYSISPDPVETIDIHQDRKSVV